MPGAVVENPAPLNPYLTFPFRCEPMPLRDLVTQRLVVLPDKELSTTPSENPLQFEP